jgi:hypothetical protein
MRRNARARRSSGRITVRTVRTNAPKPLRMERISAMLRVLASARTASAIAQNDNRAPVIHKMTRPRWV